VSSDLGSRPGLSLASLESLLMSGLRNISDPRALALVLEQAEEKLAKDMHPDPYRGKSLHGLYSSADARRSDIVPRRNEVVSPGHLSVASKGKGQKLIVALPSLTDRERNAPVSPTS